MTAPAPTAGQCGRCGAHGPTVTSSRIVSERFTEFDTWPFGSRRLCVPCAWAYSHKLATQPAMLITTTTTTQYANGADLAPALTKGALQSTEAVMVPGRQRRRHVLPTTRWGHLNTDRVAIPWDETAARRLTDQVWLRVTIGAAWTQLAAPAPPASLLTAQPGEVWPRIVAAWESLQVWRTIPPLWAATSILSNQPRG